MMVFLIATIIVALYLWLNEEKYRKYGVIVSFLLILFLFAFRDYAGVDDINYRIYFDMIKSGKTDMFFSVSGVEFSYYIIAKILALCNFNYKSLFCVYSMISFFFLYKIISKFNFNKKEYLIFFLSFLAFSLLPFITIMRQFTASMIGIYAILEYMDSRKVKGILLLILSFLFHNTAIIFTGILLLLNIKFINKILVKKITYIILPITAFILNKTNIFYLIISIVLKNTPYYSYIENMGKVNFGGTGIIVIILFLMYIFGVVVCDKEMFSRGKYKYLMIFQLLFFSMYFLTTNMGVLGRLYDYFILFEPLSLIIILKNINKWTNKLPYNLPYEKCFMILSVVFLFLFVFYNTCYNNVERFAFDKFSINFVR